jgi:hypothetical protein
LAAALIVAGIWAYISNRNTQQQAAQKAAEEKKVAETAAVISNLTNIDPKTLDEGAKNQVGIADGKAAEADKKLQLIAVEMIIPGALAISTGDVNYVYSSSSDKINNWVISISNSSGKFVRSRTPKEDYMGDLKVIDRAFWQINYVSALQIAEKNGGLDYRNGTDVSQVVLTLKNAEPKGWLYWFVDYYGPGNMKEVQIDAGNGSIVLPSS